MLMYLSLLSRILRFLNIYFRTTYVYDVQICLHVVFMCRLFWWICRHINSWYCNVWSFYCLVVSGKNTFLSSLYCYYFVYFHWTYDGLMSEFRGLFILYLIKWTRAYVARYRRNLLIDNQFHVWNVVNM